MKNNIIEHPLYEKILKEFHHTKNGNLKLSDFSCGSHKKVWWKCDKANDHEWMTPVHRRTYGKSTCPFCSGHKTTFSNCLTTLFPEIYKQIHPTKNEKLQWNNIGFGSSTKVWWKCDKASDHEWYVSVNNRTSGKTGCPYCVGQKVSISNCLATIFPETSKQWHPTKNGSLTPYDVTSRSTRRIYWICENGHEWKATIDSRGEGRGCNDCRESHGEKVIALFLDKEFIIYEREKKFDNCKYKRKLPFDFYLSNNNILIEYDGIQHYESNKFMGGEKAFKDLQLRDEIKTKFAKDNNIPLLRIPYTEFNNIEGLINSFVLKESKKDQL